MLIKEEEDRSREFAYQIRNHVGGYKVQILKDWNFIVAFLEFKISNVYFF